MFVNDIDDKTQKYENKIVQKPSINTDHNLFRSEEIFSFNIFTNFNNKSTSFHIHYNAYVFPVTITRALM